MSTSRSSSRRIAPILVASGILGALLGHATASLADEPPPDTACLTVRGEAWQQAYGYRHVVTVENGCERPARCEVWTTADPTPRHTLDVPPGESRSATTRIGSPAREVVAQSECELR